LRDFGPSNRGAHLSRNVLLLEEALGRAMGMGMIYGLATLKYPHMQLLSSAWDGSWSASHPGSIVR
jgi:hypothetical protein